VNLFLKPYVEKEIGSNVSPLDIAIQNQMEDIVCVLVEKCGKSIFSVSVCI